MCACVNHDMNAVYSVAVFFEYLIFLFLRWGVGGWEGREVLIMWVDIDRGGSICISFFACLI